MLIKLALGNLCRNFRNYWAYFLSSVFSAFVLYLFLSICFGEATKAAVSQATGVLFGIGAFLTASFAAFFIWYSNSFFIKSRKKEFATYLLLGMSKRQTIRLCVLENIVILVLAWLAGITVGILLNKLLILLLFRIMGVEAAVVFGVSSIALKLSSLVYAGVLAVVCLHSVVILGRSSLIDLMNASKKAERPMEASGRTWVVGLLAVGCLGLGYYLAVTQSLNIVLWVPIVALVCIGTMLAFLGLATLLLHFSRKKEARLYRGANLITVSQLMHRYRGNVGTLSTIAITTTVALCAVLFCCGLFTQSAENSRAMRPFSLEINTETIQEEAVDRAADAHREVQMRSRTPIDVVRVSVTHGGTEDTFQIISQSQYNAIAQALGWKERAALAGDDAAILVLDQALSNFAPQDRFGVPAGDGTAELTIAQTQYRNYVSFDRFLRSLVVTDRMYERIAPTPDAEKISLVGYILDNDFAAEGLIASLRAGLPDDAKLYTFYEHYRETMMMYGVMMFVGVFVGLLFITATGSILYFRMSMEASEDREKFRTLLKLGIGRGQLRQAIAGELAIVFGAPLVLAILNSFMASIALCKIVNSAMMAAFVVIAAVYTLAYALYFLVTMNRYMKTVCR